jgi:hypothetical protein
MSKKISDAKTREKFREWIRENIISPETVDYLDVEAEFGTDLTFTKQCVSLSKNFRVSGR